MIECRLGAETKDWYVSIRGDLGNLAEDLAVLINSIYNSIRQKNPEAAEFFAVSFPRMLTDLKDEIFGPEIMEGVAIGTVIKKRKEEAADD
nr:MAG TPA: hypothetical protein [Caudoviricetes sp.]